MNAAASKTETIRHEMKDRNIPSTALRMIISEAAYQ